MANLVLYILLLFSFHSITTTMSMSMSMSSPQLVATKNSNPSAPTNFIISSCRATLYPLLCIQSLSIYATKIQQNDRELAAAALSVSVAKARFTALFVSKLTQVSGIKPREYQAVKDCIDIMGDTVDQLSRSIKELDQTGRVRGGQEFMWHMSNVQTWVSAALTDENTCVDGFSGKFMNGNVKAAIKRRIVTVAQVTSNALALVNRFAERHHR